VPVSPGRRYRCREPSPATRHSAAIIRGKRMNRKSEIHDSVDQRSSKRIRSASVPLGADSPMDVETSISPEILNCARRLFLKLQNNPRRRRESQHLPPPSLRTPNQRPFSICAHTPFNGWNPPHKSNINSRNDLDALNTTPRFLRAQGGCRKNGHGSETGTGSKPNIRKCPKNAPRRGACPHF
jgi:hypothetical protein